MTITEFLEARIAEDEQLARSASVSRQGRTFEDEWEYAAHVVGGDNFATPAHHRLITVWWPGKVLAECAAKRAIIKQHGDFAESAAGYVGIAALGARCAQEASSDALKALAAVYKDHPDYQQEWAA